MKNCVGVKNSQTAVKKYKRNTGKAMDTRFQAINLKPAKLSI